MTQSETPEYNLSQTTAGAEGQGDGTVDPNSALGGPSLAGVDTGASNEELESDAQSSDEPQTGDTRTMDTPGSSKTEDSASQGHRIAGDDNRQ